MRANILIKVHFLQKPTIFWLYSVPTISVTMFFLMLTPSTHVRIYAWKKKKKINSSNSFEKNSCSFDNRFIWLIICDSLLLFCDVRTKTFVVHVGVVCVDDELFFQGETTLIKWRERILLCATRSKRIVRDDDDILLSHFLWQLASTVAERTIVC